MGGHRARQYWEHIGLMMLMGSLLLAPAAWFLDLQVSYAMVKWTCDEDRKALLLLVPAFSLGLVGIAGWMAWSSWLKLRNEAVPAGGRMEDRSYFLAIAGLGTSALFALLILSSLVPRIMLSPCE
jgi:hypothetical protein